MRYTVENIQGSRLGAYKEAPQDICQHFQDEEKDRGAYAGRPILELLQNVEDALRKRNNPDLPAEVAFFLEREADKSFLYICNHGSPFNGRGLQAICDRSDSTKSDDGYIGNKGTGFKSILNWTQRPEIHSGEIHCEFDRQKALLLLRQHVGEETLNTLASDERAWRANQAPLLRLPHPKSSSEKVQRLLADGWDTVLCFEIAETKFDDIVFALEEFEPEWLLFLRHINSVKIRILDVDHTYLVERRTSQALRTNVWQSSLALGLPDGSLHTFEVFRQKLPLIKPADGKGSTEIAIAVRIDLVPDRDSFVANFFPTREPSPLPRLFIHGTFLLGANRNHIEESETAFHKALNHRLAHLLTLEVVPFLVENFQEKALEYLMLKSVAGNSESSLASLCVAIKGHLSKQQFLPEISNQYCIAPSSVKLWRWGLGDLLIGVPLLQETRALLSYEWQVNHCEILKSYGAQELDGHGHLTALLESAFVPRDFDQAIATLKLVRHSVNGHSKDIVYISKDDKSLLQSLKIWLTDKGEFRALKGKKPFFIMLPVGFLSPSWLHVDILNNKYMDESFDIFQSLKKGYEEFLFPGNITKIVANLITPTLKNSNDEWWDQHGDEALTMLASLDLESTDETPFFDDIRRDLATTFRLCPSDGGWHSAWKFYAGKGWDGVISEQCVNALPDRYLVKSPQPDDFDLKKLANTYRYLGVSWNPKILPQEISPKWCNQRAYLSSKPPFRNLKIVESWKRYCAEYLHVELSESDEKYPKDNKQVKIALWRIKKVWAAEGLPEIASANLSHQELIGLLGYLGKALDKAKVVIKRAGPQYGDRQVFTPTVSFLYWQIRNETIFHTPDAFLSRTGVYSSINNMLIQRRGQARWTAWVPKFIFDDVDDEDTRIQLEGKAVALGAQTDLQKVSNQQWIAWYEKVTYYGSIGSGQALDASYVSKFCDDFARHFEPDNYQVASIPCSSEEGYKFVPKDDAFIIDEPTRLPLKKLLIEAGLNICLLVAGSGKKFADTFGLGPRLLSSQLDVSVSSSEESEVPVDGFEWAKIFGRKYKILSLVNVAKSEEHAQKLAASWPEAIRLHAPLTVRLELGSKKLGAQSFPHFEEGTIWHISKSNYQQNIAKALAYQVNTPTLEDTLGLYFLKHSESEEDAAIFLQSKGVTEEILEHWSVYESPVEGERVPPPIKPPEKPIKGPTDTPPEKPPKKPPKKPPSGSPGPPKEPPNKPPTTGGGSGGNNEGRSPEAWQNGAEAETWFKENIVKNLQNDWHIVHGEGGGNKPFDLLISNGEQVVYIEVKAESGKFFWSEKEVEKALSVEESRNEYIVAIINPHATGEPEDNVRWFFKPLAECTTFVLKGERSWTRTETVASVSPWAVPEPEGHPDTLGTNFKFVIRLPEDNELEMLKGWTPLKNYLSKISSKN